MKYQSRFDERFIVEWIDVQNWSYKWLSEINLTGESLYPPDVKVKKKSACPVLKKRTRNYREERDLQLVERRNFAEFETRIHQSGVTRWLAFAVARVLRESGRADTVSPS